jgi:hypothetical protein
LAENILQGLEIEVLTIKAETPKMPSLSLPRSDCIREVDIGIQKLLNLLDVAYVGTTEKSDQDAFARVLITSCRLIREKT